MRQAINNLVMLRTRGVGGMLAQRIGENTYVHSQGAFFGPGMPGDGASAIRGITEDEFSFLIYFNRCVDISGPQYATLTRESGGTTTLTSVQKVSDKIWRYTTNVPIVAGDKLTWEYESGWGIITDCKDGVELPDQSVDVANNLMLAGYHFLLESGGIDILLVEEDTADTDGIILEEAA